MRRRDPAKRPHEARSLILGLSLLMGLLAWLPSPAGAPAAEPRVVDLTRKAGLSAIFPELRERRVAFVGETHDRYDHHLNQLAVVRALHRQDPQLAIGVEWFQQPFQAALDAYIAGDMDLRGLLTRTEYFERWGYDFRLYAPILQFARQNGIPVVALNLRNELVRQVRQQGLEGLNEDLRGQLPREIDRSNTAYRDRLREVFEEHAREGHATRFQSFYEAQLVWDEAMAGRAAQYLREHPNDRMVVLAGNGHLAYGAGIPDRLARRLDGVAASILLNDWQGPVEAGLADYLLVSEPRRLPEAGRLGIYMEAAQEGVAIRRFAPDSAARAAGLHKDERIVAVEGRPVTSPSALKASLWDRMPGDEIALTLQSADGPSRSVRVTLR